MTTPSSPDSSEKEQPVFNGEAASSSLARGSIPSGAWHYIVVRRELSGGALLAQVAHAAGESAATLGRPLPTDTRACVLVATKEQLAAVLEGLAFRGDQNAIARIDETDGPLAGSTTALGIVTFNREALKPLLGHLKPWRAP